jgi:hypothetical protein
MARTRQYFYVRAALGGSHFTFALQPELDQPADGFGTREARLFLLCDPHFDSGFGLAPAGSRRRVFL